MIFSTGLNKIYESINKQNEATQASLFSQLQEKIVKNPILSHKYDLLESIKANKNSMNKDQAAKFVAKLKNAHNKFLKESNSVAMFYREEKALFEFFNINQRDIISSKLDLIVGKKSNELNESVILEYVTNPNLRTGKEVINEARNSQKEDFKNIRSEGNISALERKLATIAVKATALQGKKKELVESSIKAIKTEAYSDFDSACNKGFKLSMLTEKLLFEDWNDDYFDGANIPGKGDGIRNNASDADYEDFEDDEDPTLKSYKSTAAYTNLKNVEIGYPHKAQAEYITLDFRLPIYPVVSSYSDGLVAMPKYRKLFLSLKTAFIKQGMMQTGSKILDISDMQWNASIPVNIDKSVFEKAISNQQPFVMAGKFEVTVHISIGTSPEKYIQVAEKALQLFDAALPAVPGMSQILSPDEQLELLSTATVGRKTSYDNRENDKYYKDTHSKNFVDNHTDDFLRGDAEDSAVDNTEDKEFFGDSKKKNKKAEQPVSEFGDDMDDDALDKKFQAKAKGGF